MRVVRITPITDWYERHETVLGSRIQASTAEPPTTHYVSGRQPTQSAAFRPFEQLRSVALFVF
jgi:hypothetical protein